MADWTTCSTCDRVVWVSDVDDDGNCIFHQKPKGKKGDKQETKDEETPTAK